MLADRTHGPGRRAGRGARRGAGRAGRRRRCLEGGEPAAAAGGSAGIGKRRLLAELGGAGGRARRMVSEAAPRARARPAVLGVRGRAGRVRGGPRPRRLGRAGGRVGDGAGARLPVAVELAGERTSRRSRTSATARTGPCEKLLERLAATEPMVLVLDDVHWADKASVELLGALLRRPPGGGCADRDGSARQRQLAERLDASARAGSTRESAHPLEPRSWSKTTPYGFWATRSTASWPRLFAESGGIPFYRGRSPERGTRERSGRNERDRSEGRGGGGNRRGDRAAEQTERDEC